MQAGVRIAFGFDWPVVPPSALAGVHAAAHRAAPGQAHAHASEEALTPEAALATATRTGAVLAGLQAEIGTLAVGKHADFDVLSKSPLFGEANSALPQMLQTYVDGRCAFGCSTGAAHAGLAQPAAWCIDAACPNLKSVVI
ncbi:hypothetical protein WJX81_004702 [Elliptochloris bilobata]|uniref:Amidohydrolase 3 domain-containing protein n=1 Tax=Elliptochloris bilobata TaxID=381761 RepID=A0AAW1RS49_9CHLO